MKDSSFGVSASATRTITINRGTWERFHWETFCDCVAVTFRVLNKNGKADRGAYLAGTLRYSPRYAAVLRGSAFFCIALNHKEKSTWIGV